MNNNISLAEIQKMAKGANLASFDGNRVGTEGYGKQNRRASFDGGVTASGVNFTSTKIASVTINNTTEADVRIALFAAYDRVTDATVNKLAANAIITGVTGSGSPKSILNLQTFVKYNPSKVMGFKIKTNVAGQLSEVMTLNYQSPFNTMSDEIIDLSSYTSENSFNDTLLTVNRPFQLDNQTELTVNIPAGAKTTFTFYFGDILNTAAALEAGK